MTTPTCGDDMRSHQRGDKKYGRTGASSNDLDQGA
jgi:hypothetical protein